MLLVLLSVNSCNVTNLSLLVPNVVILCHINTKCLYFVVVEYTCILASCYGQEQEMAVILTLRLLMSYIYEAPIHDLSRGAACSRSPAEIVGSNPTGGMDIFLL